jgi:hypothetical protein
MSHFRLACHMSDESRLSSDNSIYENTNYVVPLCTLPHLPLNKSVDPNFLLITQPENSVCACMIPLRLYEHVLKNEIRRGKIMYFGVHFCVYFSKIK